MAQSPNASKQLLNQYPFGKAVFSILYLLRFPIAYPLLLRACWTIWWDFFWTQYDLVLGLRKRNVTDISHPSDQKIRFYPEAISIYMRFIDLPLGALVVLLKHQKKSGTTIQQRKKCNTVMNDVLVGFEKAYAAAAAVYKPFPTTTPRPNTQHYPKVKWVYALDPHTNCLPSLHIIISAYTYAFVCHFDSDKSKFSQQVWDEAVAIGASVLWVKQHSIHCLPAALVLLEEIEPHWNASLTEKYLESVVALLNLEENLNQEISAEFVRLQNTMRLRSREIGAIETLKEFIQTFPSLGISKN